MAADSRKRRLMDGLAPSDAPTAVETPNPAIVNGGADLKRPHVSKSSDSGEPTEDLTVRAARTRLPCACWGLILPEFIAGKRFHAPFPE